MLNPVGDRTAERLRDHPFAVDAAIAAAVFLVTVVLSSPVYGPGEETASVIGLLLTAPLAWRRRAPVPAAAIVVAAGLLELRVVDSFLPANVSALAMVYALADYGPLWAGRTGLGVGLVGAFLAALPPVS